MRNDYSYKHIRMQQSVHNKQCGLVTANMSRVMRFTAFHSSELMYEAIFLTPEVFWEALISIVLQKILSVTIADAQLAETATP